MSDPEYLQSISSVQDLKPGDVVVRRGPEKHQQGGFAKLADDGSSAIVVNVIDLNEPGFLAGAGIIKPDAGDQLFRHKTTFAAGGDRAAAATEVLHGWSLFRDHAPLQREMLEFLQAAYSPDQILDFKKREEMRMLFVPLQQAFKIGKFKEKVDWRAVEFQRFADALLSLEDGKHMTYVAFIPRDTTSKPRFYTIGTKPHHETMVSLEREPFAFKPNRGGHIKIVSEQDVTPRHYLVDAGSNDLGSGIHTSLATAEMVVENLGLLYPEHEYEPLAGRGAHGIHQSY